MVRHRAPSAATRSVLAFLHKHRGTSWHGYAISGETGVKAGTLYPMLIRLEQQGFLEASWEEAEQGGRPPRHIYQLTAEGYAFAQSIVDASDTQAAKDGGLRGSPA